MFWVWGRRPSSCRKSPPARFDPKRASFSIDAVTFGMADFAADVLGQLKDY
jgi:hypothetical protein